LDGIGFSVELEVGRTTDDGTPPVDPTSTGAEETGLLVGGTVVEVGTETTDDDDGMGSGDWFPVPTIVVELGTGVTISVVIVVV